MTTATLTLSEFLLARIAEDETLAKAAVGCNLALDMAWTDLPVARHLYNWSSARVVAECAAKRRIVEELRSGSPANRWAEEAWRTAEGDVLRLLALPYADHPDYRQEWRP